MKRLDGVFFTQYEGEHSSHLIKMKVEENFGEPRIVRNGSINIAGFAIEAERDKYFAEWHDEELESLYRMIHQMYEMPASMKRKPLSDSIEKLKNRVQRRARIANS
jgi:hypothetical protein